MNLLIVDDESIFLKAMTQSINWASLGIKSIFSCTQISQAKTICLNNEIHLALCDIEMPGGSGIDLLYWIREHYPLIECAFLTCHADFTFAQQALKLRSFDYLVKPVPFNEIAQLVGRMIVKIDERKNAEQERFYGVQWLKEKFAKSLLQPNAKKSNQEIVDDVISFVVKNISKDLTVEGLAKKVYLNPDYLNRIFKKEQNISLSQFIIRERMNLAARMLLESNASISLIALETGYSNYSNFVNMFKKIHGCTPSEYKSNYFKDN